MFSVRIVLLSVLSNVEVVRKAEIDVQMRLSLSQCRVPHAAPESQACDPRRDSSRVIS